ncbi:MAG: hypothetical protein HYS66_07335 [Deltaproteobacteria bacterium]|nr:hypothetical protein [Deltaproteobacteria bacterium]
MKSGSPTLRSAILALKKELKILRKEILEEKEQRVLGAIIRRGLRCYPREEDRGVLLPSAKRFRVDFYSHLKKYSFRLFLRDVIKNKGSFSLADLLRYCSERSAKEYLRVLVRVGVVLPMRQSRFMLKDTRISSFGETLEWFVCQILEKEFYLPSLWGFRVKENRGGGDFDVVALMEGSLVYVETKSSPPKHIEQRDIQAFFDRLEVLAPDLAIYLEDTQLRMKDKIAIMFEKELRRRFGSSWREGHPLNRLRRETFGIEDRLFITNSDPDLIANLGFCLGRYLRSRAAKIGGGKEAILWGP